MRNCKPKTYDRTIDPQPKNPWKYLSNSDYDIGMGAIELVSDLKATRNFYEEGHFLNGRDMLGEIITKMEMLLNKYDKEVM